MKWITCICFHWCRFTGRLLEQHRWAMNGSTTPCLRQKRQRSAKPARGSVSAFTCTMKTRHHRRPTISPHRLCRPCSVQICAWGAVLYCCWSVSLSDTHPIAARSLSCCNAGTICCLLVLVALSCKKMLSATIGMDYGTISIYAILFCCLPQIYTSHTVQVYRKIHVPSNLFQWIRHEIFLILYSGLDADIFFF